MGVTVRAVEASDEPAWRALWDAYLAFYESALPEAVTSRTWARILDTDPAFQAILAVDAGDVVGFATLVLHDYTWSDRPAGLLHDLYVRPDRRGSGAGRALIQYLVDQGTAEGWSRLYWLTREDNAAARRLYDTFVPADGFIRYRLPLPGVPEETP